MLKVQLIAHTPQPEKVVAAAAKLCYSNADIDNLFENLTDAESSRFVKMLADLGHGSPAEHAVFTFAIEGVSRSLLAQITRHRIASFSVQSQRYVTLDGFNYVTPPEIAGIAEANELFEQAMQQEAGLYEKLTETLKKHHKNTFLAEGLSEKQADAKAQKQAIEDARFVLPNACHTKMIATMNARSLQHFFQLRCCNRAQWEIRALADEMLKLAIKASPALFVTAGPACVHGSCSEGSMTCGKMAEVQKAYKKMYSEVTSGNEG